LGIIVRTSLNHREYCFPDSIKYLSLHNPAIWLFQLCIIHESDLKLIVAAIVIRDDVLNYVSGSDTGLCNSISLFQVHRRSVSVLISLSQDDELFFSISFRQFNYRQTARIYRFYETCWKARYSNATCARWQIFT